MISPIVAKDAQALAQLHKQSYATPWSFDSLLGQESVRGFKEASSRGGNADMAIHTKGLHGLPRHYVARNDEMWRLKGFILYSTIPPISDMLMLCTHPQFRRQKIAATLLSTMITDLKEKHMEKILLEVSHLNLPALSLYEAFHFKKIHIRKNYYEDRSDAYVMELFL